MDYARRLLIDALALAEDELQAREEYLSRSRSDSPFYQISRTRVRLKTAEVADLTKALAALEPKDTAPTDYNLCRFKRGDYIEVTAKREEDDFGIVRGTALDDREFIGWASFDIEDEKSGSVLTYNLNSVNVKLLHSADIARGVDVPTGEC